MPLPAIAAGGTLLSMLAVSMVTRVLLTLGFGIATYYGIGEMFAEAETFIDSNLGSTSTSIISLLAMARVDDYIKLVLSAYGAVLAMRGILVGASLAVGYWGASSSS